MRQWLRERFPSSLYLDAGNDRVEDLSNDVVHRERDGKKRGPPGGHDGWTVSSLSIVLYIYMFYGNRSESRCGLTAGRRSWGTMDRKKRRGVKARRVQGRIAASRKHLLRIIMRPLLATPCVYSVSCLVMRISRYTSLVYYNSFIARGGGGE